MSQSQNMMVREERCHFYRAVRDRTDTNYYTFLSDGILHLLGVTTMKEGQRHGKNTVHIVPFRPAQT